MTIEIIGSIISILINLSIIVLLLKVRAALTINRPHGNIPVTDLSNALGSVVGMDISNSARYKALRYQCELLVKENRKRWTNDK